MSGGRPSVAEALRAHGSLIHNNVCMSAVFETALASGSLGAWTTCIQPRAMVGDLPARGSLSLSSMIPRSWLMVVAERSERNGG